jgi:hypothetical protein
MIKYCNGLFPPLYGVFNLLHMGNLSVEQEAPGTTPFEEVRSLKGGDADKYLSFQ